jgi:hypothetical protein
VYTDPRFIIINVIKVLLLLIEPGFNRDLSTQHVKN